MYLLDTNIVSELRKPKPHGGVVAWVESVPDEDLHISAVSIGEIQRGVEQLTREGHLDKASQIEIWLGQVASTLNVLPMDAEAFRIHAKLMSRQSDTVYEDAMIAATALQHKLTVVTRNVGDFKRFDVPLFNPFNG